MGPCARRRELPCAAGCVVRSPSPHPGSAILDIDNRPFSVPRSSLQIVPLRPQRGPFVARPSDAVMVR